MPPMATNMGITSDQALAYYWERAKGGVGTVIVEGTNVRKFKSENFLENLSRLPEKLKAEESTPIIQLTHDRNFSGEKVDVSATGKNRKITKKEIDKIVENFQRAASRAEQSGFKGAEVHGAHHFFINQFFSPAYNRRNDKYGGELKGRMKLGKRIVKAMDKTTNDNFLILYRHTPVWYEDEKGYGLSDTISYVKELIENGLDIIDISPSQNTKTETPFGKDAHAGLSGAVKSKIDIPVIAVGEMKNPKKAEKALTEEKADLVAIGRGLIADPHLVQKIKQEKTDQIIECIKCNEKCYGNLEKGIPISCTQNPQAGKEYQSMTL